MNPAFDPLSQRYSSQRYPIYARDGMVNCSCPQAASAGLEILQAGGNAMDAAVAAAATLTVTEPTANGIGGDAFALIWSEKDRRLYGLNASGPAPMLAEIGRVLEDGYARDGKMPAAGWAPVTVPGVPKAWAEISRRFGALPLSGALAPAVRYAREGAPLVQGRTESAFGGAKEKPGSLPAGSRGFFRREEIRIRDQPWGRS